MQEDNTLEHTRIDKQSMITDVSFMNHSNIEHGQHDLSQISEIEIADFIEGKKLQVFVDEQQSYLFEAHYHGNSIRFYLKEFDFFNEKIKVYDYTVSEQHLHELIPSTYEDLTQIFTQCIKHKKYEIQTGCVVFEYKVVRHEQIVSKDLRIKLKEFPIDEEQQRRQIINQLKKYKLFDSKNNGDQVQRALQFYLDENKVLKEEIHNLNEKVELLENQNKSALEEKDEELKELKDRYSHQKTYESEYIKKIIGKLIALRQQNMLHSSPINEILSLHHLWCTQGNILICQNAYQVPESINQFQFFDEMNLLMYFPAKSKTTLTFDITSIAFANIYLQGLSRSPIHIASCKQDRLRIQINMVIGKFCTWRDGKIIQNQELVGVFENSRKYLTIKNNKYSSDDSSARIKIGIE